MPAINNIVIRRGYTYQQIVAAPAYPQEGGWVLTWRASGAGRTTNTPLDYEDGQWTLNMAATVTSSLPVGQYSYEVVATRNAAVALVVGGVAAVVGSVQAEDLKDGSQTWAQRMLAEVERTLSTMSGSGVTTITVDGLTQTFETRLELLAFRGQLQTQVEQEEARAALGTKRTGTVRVRPSRRGRRW